MDMTLYSIHIYIYIYSPLIHPSSPRLGPLSRRLQTHSLALERSFHHHTTPPTSPYRNHHHHHRCNYSAIPFRLWIINLRGAMVGCYTHTHTHVFACVYIKPSLSVHYVCICITVLWRWTAEVRIEWRGDDGKRYVHIPAARVQRERKNVYTISSTIFIYIYIIYTLVRRNGAAEGI